MEFQLILVINGWVMYAEPSQYGQRQEAIQKADEEEIELEGHTKGVR